MRVECSMCGRPLTAPEGRSLVDVECPCGAVGNWQQAKTTEESFAEDLAGLVEKARADGVSEKRVASILADKVARVALDVKVADV